ncbi:MAG: trigger factor [Lachnospiraceae bacterium]|nr:trigger factor [Lachnospiraceae bacterium]
MNEEDLLKAAESTADEAKDAAENTAAEATEAVKEKADEVKDAAEGTLILASEEAVGASETAEKAVETAENAAESLGSTVTASGNAAPVSGQVVEKVSKKTTIVLISTIVVLVALIVVFGVMIGKKFLDKKNADTDPENGQSATVETATPTAAATSAADSDYTDEEQTIKEYDVTVELGQYKGLEIDFPEINITEEEIHEMVDDFVEDLAEDIPVDRPAENGDNLNIDYVGYMDGEEFEGGKDENVDMVLGDGYFFDAFEEGLVGKGLGEHTLELNFPDDYYEDLAGKPVTFVVTINSITITEIPELSDELIAENTEYSNIEEYRAYVKGELEEEARLDAEEHLDRDILYMAIDNATFGGEIDEEIDDLTRQYFDYYDQMAQSYYGMTGAQLFSAFYGMTEEDYNATIKEESSYSVKLQHLLSKVAEEENITYTEEEYKSEFEEIFFSYYGFTEEAEVKEQLSDEEIDKIVINSIKQKKAQDIITENAVVNR